MKTGSVSFFCPGITTRVFSAEKINLHVLRQYQYKILLQINSAIINHEILNVNRNES